MRFFSKAFESQINGEVERRIKEHFAEQTASIQSTRQELSRRLNKSREYRIMLRDYQEELREREQNLDRREAELVQREATTLQRVTREAYDAEQQIKLRVCQLQEYMEGLHRTEAGIMEWIKRREAEDLEILAELALDAEKQKMLCGFIDNFDGARFEEYIIDLLTRNGFCDVSHTPKSGDYGADVLGEKDSIKYVFQCKFYTGPVGIEAVQQVHSAKTHYLAHIAVVVTNNVFTKAAKLLAKETGVLLWDGEVLLKMKNSH